MKAQRGVSAVAALLCVLAVALGHPANGGPAMKLAAHRKSNPDGSLDLQRVKPSRALADDDDGLLDESSEEEELDAEGEESAPAAKDPPKPRRKSSSKGSRYASSGKGTRSGKRRKATPPPSTLDVMSAQAASLWSSMADRTAKLKEDVAQALEERKARLEAAAAERREAQLQAQAELHERIRRLREEAEALEPRKPRRPTNGGSVGTEGTEGAEGAETEEEEDDLTLAERGALIGSVLLSPSGIAGVVVGGAVGGAAGFVAEHVENVRSHVASAYTDRVASEREIAKTRSEASEQLQSLQAVSISGAVDDAEAERWAAELSGFVTARANQQCADCGVDIEGLNGAWASINLKVVTCVRCAGVHRSLGTATSRIKSVVYDRWTPAMVEALVEGGGNGAAREIYLQRLPPDYVAPTEDSSDEELAAHIRDK